MERRQYFLNEGGDNSNHLLGLSDDHALVHGWMTMKSSPTPIMGNQWSDELGAVLISGNRSRSHFESNSPIHQNLSSPPPGARNDTTFSSGGHSHNKRKATSSCDKVGGEKKKMKIYEEEDSRISEQNSNSTTAAAVAAAGKTSETTKSDNNSKASEAPKTSYIHVRARRGQATDSHSLAERVRREKISERMKYLQDLVPGCNKITGKAGVLDEIINYVQSLQRQVEFLSMKLAALSPRMNLEMGNYIPKDIYPSSEMGTHFQLENHSDLRRTIAAPAPAPAPVTLTNPEALLSPSSHISWENPFIHQSSFFPGFMGTGNVKMEI